MFDCVYDRNRSTSVLGYGSLTFFATFASPDRSVCLSAICSISDQLRNSLPVNRVAFTPHTWLAIKLYSGIFQAVPTRYLNKDEPLV